MTGLKMAREARRDARLRQPLNDAPKLRRPPRRRIARRLRILSAVLVVPGVLLASIAFSIFFGQRGEINVTARVLAAPSCVNRYDVGSRRNETLCDAPVRFMTRTGQVVTTTITGADPSEFQGHGQSTTIGLRYYSNDPSQPDEQGNAMGGATFGLLLTFASVALIGGILGFMRAGRIADRMSGVPIRRFSRNNS